MNYYNKYVPGEGTKGAPILLIGEAPGETEHDEGRPFVGESGRLLRDTLNRHGISSADDCYITNLCHYRPFKNDFKLVLDEQILKDGLKEVYEYINTYKPNVVVPLGNWSLKYITGRNGIKKWRGSIINTAINKSVKCISTVHPAAILRDGSLYPTFDLDIKRISDDAKFPELRLPERRFVINPRGLELEEWILRCQQAEYLACDIESVKNSRKIICVGFSPAPNVAVCLSTDSNSNKEAIRRILEDGRSKKIFQFGTYDTIQLVELNGYTIKDDAAQLLDRPYFWDTNNAQHCLAPELPRSLEYLTSIYTREPYYKSVGRGTIPDDEKGWSERVEKQSLYEYNCRDDCCTLDVALEQMKEIAKNNLDHQMQFSMESVEVARHVSVSGMLVDEERRSLLERGVYHKLNQKQLILNKLCGAEVNVRSPKLKDILYGKLNLPPRFKDKKVTTNEDAIVSLIGFCKGKVASYKTEEKKLEWRTKLGVCKLILEIRGLRVLISNYLRILQKNRIPRITSDGRIHSTYKACGTETARWSASKFCDGTGFNSQTLPRDPIEIDDIVMIEMNLEQFDDDEMDDEVEEQEEAA